MLAAGAMITAFGVVSMTPTHSAPARRAGAKRDPAGPGGLVRNDVRAALRCPDLRRQMREVGLPIVGLAEQRAEFARTIRMNEIVALPVDDIDRLARPHR